MSFDLRVIDGRVGVDWALEDFPELADSDISPLVCGCSARAVVSGTWSIKSFTISDTSAMFLSLVVAGGTCAGGEDRGVVESDGGSV